MDGDGRQNHINDTSAQCSVSPTAMTGIDWSIFRDGEESAFGWLLRTSANFIPSTPRTSDVTLAPPLAVEPIQLDAHTTSTGLSNAPSGGVSLCSSLETQSDGSVDSTTPKASTGKRPLKRKRSNESDEDAKKQIRRLKNLVSVREFRKRKMQQQQQNEARLKRLEAENLDLKMRLKIGKEALVSEQQEKKQIKEQMREMIKRNASEQEIAQFLNMYKVTYSDYGPKRREKIQFHLSRIRELLLPTQVTKLCLYSVEQGRESMVRAPEEVAAGTPSEEDPTAPLSLWNILAKELDVTEAQQRQILDHRESIRKVRNELNHTLSILEKLEEVTEEKNTALEAQIAELQHILTPSQATKFIIWVKENPAFMYMLDKLVDSTLMTSSLNN